MLLSVQPKAVNVLEHVRSHESRVSQNLRVSTGGTIHKDIKSSTITGWQWMTTWIFCWANWWIFVLKGSPHDRSDSIGTVSEIPIGSGRPW